MNKKNLAREIGVSRASLYYKSVLSPKDAQLKQQILATWEAHPAYGHRRLAIHLHCNRKRLLRVMKKFHLETPIKRKRKQPGYSSVNDAKHSNWLQKICPLAANVCWASDFTYLWYQGKWLYMATIIDVYTRELIGLAFSNYHNQGLILDALQDALKYKPAPRYLHSDQGSEYGAEDYIAFVEALGIVVSFSAKGKPWHNGFQESFYSQFKVELGNITRFADHALLLEAVYRQIYYYNHSRIHLALQMPPVTFALMQKKKQEYHLQKML
jgi:transposase InsO family protein